MNPTLVKVFRGVIGLFVLLVLIVTVRSWWTEYQATPRVSAEATQTASVAAEDTEPEGSEVVIGTLTVLVQDLKLRDKPAIDGELIRELDKKEKLTLYKKEGGWYYVHTDKDERGWVSATKGYTKLAKAK